MKAKLIHTLVFASLALPAVTWVLSSAAQAGLISVYKFDETTDNTAVDAIRPGTGDGTLSNFNGSQWVPGKFGNCVVFDGVDDYINTLNTAPTGTTAFTISVWAYAESASGWATIVKNWGHATVGSFHFGINGTANRPGNYLTHYVIETSADLSIWDLVPETSVTIDADSVDYTLPTTGPKGFVHLKVTGP
jgi:hypothetical protein